MISEMLVVRIKISEVLEVNIVMSIYKSGRVLCYTVGFQMFALIQISIEQILFPTALVFFFLFFFPHCGDGSIITSERHF